MRGYQDSVQSIAAVSHAVPHVTCYLACGARWPLHSSLCTVRKKRTRNKQHALVQCHHPCDRAPHINKIVNSAKPRKTAFPVHAKIMTLIVAKLRSYGTNPRKRIWKIPDRSIRCSLCDVPQNGPGIIRQLFLSILTLLHKSRELCRSTRYAAQASRGVVCVNSRGFKD